MLRIATSPDEGRLWHFVEHLLFARGTPIRGLAKRSETEKLIDQTVYFTTGAFQMSRA